MITFEMAVELYRDACDCHEDLEFEEPAREHSEYRDGMWHLGNADGELIAMGVAQAENIVGE